MRIRRGLALLAALLALQPRASAHAFLVSSQPAAGAVLLRAPADLVLRYTENVDARLSTFAVYDSQRNAMSGTPRIEGRIVTVPLPSLPAGTYTVRWSVTSADDGHQTQGSFLFSVWRGGPLPAGAGQAGGTNRGGIQGGVAGSLARLAALVTAFGLLGAVFLAWALGWTPPRAAVGLIGALFLLAQAVLFVVQGAAATAVGPAGFLRGGYARAALSAPFGEFAALAAAGGALAAAGSALRWRPLALVGAVAVLAGFALPSHPAASADPTVGAVVDGVHLAASAAWGGGLGWLLAAGEQRTRLLARFSPWAGGLMAVIVASGVWNTLFGVHTAAALRETLYGRVLDVKLALFLAVLAAAAFSRRAVRRGRPERAARPMAWEAALGLGVLAAAAVLAGAPPAAVTAPASSTYFLQQHRVGDLTVQLMVAPAVAGSNQVQVRVTDAAGRPVSAGDVRLTVQSLDMAMGSAEVPLTARGSGTYAATTPALSMAGTWRVTVSAAGARTAFVVTVAPPGDNGACTAGFDPDLRARVIPLHDVVRALAADPSDADTLLVGTDHGVRLTRDGGRTWTSALPARSVAAVAVARVGGNWYAATNDALWVSADRGATWSQRTVPGRGVAALVPSPTRPDGLWLAYAQGVAYSDDAGSHWRTLAGGGDVDSIAAMAQDRGHLYAGSLHGILVSDDGGKTWRLTAPRARLAYGFAPDPAHPGTVWAAAMAEGIWVTRDDGRTWQESDQGATNLGAMGVALWDGGRRLLVGTMGGGLTASDDYGASWHTVGCPAGTVITLAASPGPVVWAGDAQGVVRLAPRPGAGS